MLFLGLVLVILGFVWLIFARNFLGILVVAAGVFLLAMDIAKTIIKSVKKKKEKDLTKPLLSVDCRYEEGLPFASGNCNLTVYREYVRFDVGGKNAQIDFTRITDASASDGSFRLSYSKDGETKNVLCSYDSGSADSFTNAAEQICKNIKFEL